MQTLYKVLKVAIAASLLSGFVAAGGCARDEALPVQAAAEAADPDRIPVESALAALARFRADDPATRAEEIPVVTHVEVLMRSDVAPATRAAGADADAPLCYIAQFDGDGYAILGAHGNQAPVIAYVPKGTLSAAELADAKAATDRGEDYETPTYIHARIVDYLQAAADGSLELQREASTVSSEIHTRGLELPGFNPDEPVHLMKTTWHQDAPYNNSCPIIMGQRAKVGCVALALGQILAYNMKTYDIGPTALTPLNGLVTMNNTFYPNWGHITKAIETSEPASIYRYTIQEYLAAIGNAIDMVYGVFESKPYRGSYIVVDLLKSITGYNDVAFKRATLDDLKTQIKINKTPVFARGSSIPSSASQGIDHAWVMDGWKLKKIWVPVGGGMIGDYSKDVDYFYCRYGYKSAQHDGWYYYDSLTASGFEAYSLIDIVYYTLSI